MMKELVVIALNCKLSKKEAKELLQIPPEEYSKVLKELSEAEAVFVKKVKESLG